DGAELALPDQSQSKIREQRKIVGANKSGQLQFLAAAQFPHVVQCYERRMRLILLPWVDGVRIFRPSGSHVDRVEAKHGPQSGHVAVAEIGDAKQRQRVIVRVEEAPAIELELLAMLKPVDKSVAERAFHRGP